MSSPVAAISEQQETMVATGTAANPKKSQYEELLESEGIARDKQQPGEFWLHGAAGPQLAVARYPQAEQGAANDNKLVLGHAGSGRSLLVSRLARTAHEAGNQVVVLAWAYNPHYAGPLSCLLHKLEGEFKQISTADQLRFNPFWLPMTGGNGLGWRMPTMEELDALADLLVNVLQLTRYRQPIDQERVTEVMYQVLGSYFVAQALANSPYPCFATFASTVLSRKRGADEEAAVTAFMDWFAAVQEPFSTGELAYLLAATPEQVQELIASPSRALHVHMMLDQSCASQADTVDFSPRAGKNWSPPCPGEAQTRALMLLLYSVDTHLSQQNRRLTVVLDEQHYDSMGAQIATFLTTYLRKGTQYNREVISAWHEWPATVFGEDNPGAQVLLNQIGTQILLRSNLPREANWGPLKLSEQEWKAYSHLPYKCVLVRRPGRGYESFNAWLPGEFMTDFVPEERQARIVADELKRLGSVK